MSLVLEGTLSDVGLADLLRLIARESRSGCLRVTIDGVSWLFDLDDGYVLSATRNEAGEPTGIEPTLLMLVRYRRGAFRLEPTCSQEREDDGPGVHAEALAGLGDMEVMRLVERVDQAGGESAIPRRGSFPSSKQMDAMDAQARAVYALVNGERALTEVIVRSRLDPLDVLDAIDRLVEASLLKPIEAWEASRPYVPAATGPLRDWIATALPVTMLLLWLGLSGPLSKPERLDPFAIRHDSLAAAQAAHEVERLRAAVEAHRFAEGHWPARLQSLVERGYLPDAALTDERGRPYYYAVRDDDFVLLAPER